MRADVFVTLVPRVVRDKMHTLRISGNKAAHGQAVRRGSIEQVLIDAHAVSAWFHIAFDGGRRSSIGTFQPPVHGASGESKGQLKREKKAAHSLPSPPLRAPSRRR
jgi:type I restriction enzyme R subunit